VTGSRILLNLRTTNQNGLWRDGNDDKLCLSLSGRHGVGIWEPVNGPKRRRSQNAFSHPQQGDRGCGNLG
jgi:hypothetical protein